MREPAEREYFETHVAPHLGDGIEYLGEMSHAEKVELLQNARATLFPIEWEEPFGLVMIESMACGTPVIATRCGAVPEVIEHGRRGIIVDDYREMAGALAEADALEPLECRRYVEERFSAERMVADYVAAYEAVLAGTQRRSRCSARCARNRPHAPAPDRPSRCSAGACGGREAAVEPPPTGLPRGLEQRRPLRGRSGRLGRRAPRRCAPGPAARCGLVAGRSPDRLPRLALGDQRRNDEIYVVAADGSDEPQPH